MSNTRQSPYTNGTTACQRHREESVSISGNRSRAPVRMGRPRPSPLRPPTEKLLELDPTAPFLNRHPFTSDRSWAELQSMDLYQPFSSTRECAEATCASS